MARTREFDETEILEKAVNLFWNNGYNAVSTQDLIDSFGISKSSMYGAYKDKRSLFILALQHYRQSVSENMIQLLKSNASFEEIISQMLHNIIHETVNDPQCKGCFIVNTAIELASHDEEILGIIRQNRTNIIDNLSQAIQKGIDSQELSPKNNPKALANYFYSLINGLRVDAKVTRQKVDYQSTVDLALSVLIKN